MCLILVVCGGVVILEFWILDLGRSRLRLVVCYVMPCHAMPCLRMLNGLRERDGDAERLGGCLRIEMVWSDMLLGF